MADLSSKLTTLTTPSGKASVTVANLGATLVDYTVDGLRVVLGYQTVCDYLRPDNPYAGATIGRVSNRIANAEISLPLAGKQKHTLPSNDAYAKKGASCLHGGPDGFQQKVWSGPTLANTDGKSSATFTLEVQHLEDGFPGSITVSATYTLSETPSSAGSGNRTSLELNYSASLLPNSPVPETVIALTNHAYFTVTDAPTIAGTELRLATNSVLVVDPTTLVPTGLIGPHPAIPSVPFAPVNIGATEPNLDACFVLDADCPLDTRDRPLKRFARLYNPKTGVHLEASTTEPAFQATTGEPMGVATAIVALGGRKFESRAGFALEAQRFVNAVNVEGWVGQVRVGRGEVWGSRTAYSVWRE